MRIRCVQLVLLALMLVEVFHVVLTASAQNSSDNTTLVSENNTLTPSAQFLNVQGIWNVSMEGIGITAAVNQSGDSINGRCKFEGAEPWDGIIAGSLSGNSVNMAITAMQGLVLVSIDITGIISDDVLSGRYVSYNSDENEVSGKVTGTRISPVVTDYIPAKVEPAAEPALSSTLAAAPQPQAVQSAQPALVQQPQGSKRRVQDVTELAKGINANILPWSFPL